MPRNPSGPAPFLEPARFAFDGRGGVIVGCEEKAPQIALPTAEGGRPRIALPTGQRGGLRIALLAVIMATQDPLRHQTARFRQPQGGF